jgi:hypothetical protein
MRDDLRDAFNKVVARDQVADQERKRVGKARQDFASEFERIKDQIIVPTLNEIGNLLQEAGWSCEIVPYPPNIGFGFPDPSKRWSDASVKFEVYQGGMMAGGELDGETPSMSFVCLPKRLKVSIEWYTPSGHGSQEYLLDQVSEDFVAQQVLPFFDQLVADWDRESLARV